MDHPYSRFVSPAKCAERPWDLWVSELGYSAPRPDDGASADPKAGAARRLAHPYKAGARRPRRAGLQRLPLATMPLHGLFPQLDALNAAVCHMCGVIVKCTAAYRHLAESHATCDPLLPPPAPVSSNRVRSRHKKDHPLPPPPPELAAPRPGAPPAPCAAAPLSRRAPPPPPHYLLEPAPPPPAPAPAHPPEVQVCVESGELPVVSIQDTEELPLGENLTDDIFEIMNSEGIQSADDITDATDWKNIIRDIGNLQDINFHQTTDPVQSQDLFAASMPAAAAYGPEELAALRFPPPPPPPAPAPAPAPPDPVHAPHTPQALKPAATPSTPKSQRSRTSKTKFNLREYDANKHCGVLTAEGKACTRSLTCKAHALSLRRMVEGRAKPFDTLLAEHRAAREASAGAAAASLPAPPPPPPPPQQPVAHSMHLTPFHLTTEQQVDDIYSLLSVDDPDALLADPSALSSLLDRPMADPFVMPDEVPVQPSPVERLERPDRIDRLERTDRSERTDRHDRSDRHDRAERAERSDRHERTDRHERSRTRESSDAPAVVAGDVCWYASCPRPLAVCTYNASHAGGAITLGKKFATVRSNIKSSLSRSQCKSTGATNNFYYGQNALSLSKSVHMNASKTNKPEVRRLIVCSGTSGSKEIQTMNEIFGGEPRPMVNGHLGHSSHHGASKPRPPLKHSKHSAAPVLDLGFSLDPLLADEKC